LFVLCVVFLFILFVYFLLVVVSLALCMVQIIFWKDSSLQGPTVGLYSLTHLISILSYRTNLYGYPFVCYSSLRFKSESVVNAFKSSTIYL